jgi:deoxyguanosine kinase
MPEALLDGVSVAFEGPIGVGKTTLATLLASHWAGCELILESFQTNSFLEDFYSDKGRWALPMQLEFLVSRAEQLSIPVSGISVADYSIGKEKIFASILLSRRELSLYERVYTTVSARAREPDIYVYLDAPVDVLLRRIAARGRPMEAGIDRAYLTQIGQAYEAWFSSLDCVPLVRVDTSTLDYRADIATLATILEDAISTARCRRPSNGT